MNDCLNNLIGLTDIECDCLPEIDESNTSESGKYITSAKGFNVDVVNVKDCDDDIWDILTRAKQQAIEQIEIDLTRCLDGQAKKKYNSCKGLLVSQKSYGSQPTTDYIALTIKPKGLLGTCLNITSLGLQALSPGTIEWQILTNQNAEVVDSGTFDVVANSINNNKVDISLDLTGEGCIDLEYYLVYKLNGVQVKPNKIWCKPCGGGKSPCYDSFYSIDGYVGDDTTNIADWTKTTNVANGMLINGEVGCYVEICDYLVSDKNPLYGFITMALVNKAAELAYYRIIHSSSFNRVTTIDMDSIKSQLVDYARWYDEGMQYICQEISSQGHPCLVCDSPLKIGTIWK